MSTASMVRAARRSVVRAGRRRLQQLGSREAGSAQGPPSATERRECKSRVTLLLSQGRRLRSNRPYGCRAHPWASPPMQQLKLARS